MASSTNDVPVIDLGAVPPPATGWGRSPLVVALWRVVERVVVTSALQPSSALRAAALRTFGATVGPGVILRPRLRVRFPWNLRIGANSWIGEGVWISNREQVTIGADAVVSQETFITTGSHARSTDMRVVAAPVTIEDGAWVTARCVVLGGAVVGRSALVTPTTVVSGSVPAGAMFGVARPGVLGPRFPDRDDGPAGRVRRGSTGRSRERDATAPAGAGRGGGHHGAA